MKISVLGTVHVHSKSELEAKLSKIDTEPLTRSLTAKYLIESASRSPRPANCCSWINTSWPASGVSMRQSRSSKRALILHSPPKDAVQGLRREGEPCVVCGKPIKMLIQGGRITYFCANCERK